MYVLKKGIFFFRFKYASGEYFTDTVEKAKTFESRKEAEYYNKEFLFGECRIIKLTDHDMQLVQK